MEKNLNFLGRKWLKKPLPVYLLMLRMYQKIFIMNKEINLNFSFKLEKYRVSKIKKLYRNLDINSSEVHSFHWKLLGHFNTLYCARGLSSIIEMLLVLNLAIVLRIWT